MNLRLKMIAKLLRNLADDCERQAEGKEPLYNSNITAEEMEQIMDDLSRFNDDRLSKDGACKFLNMSRATFDRRVADGSLPKGKKEAGFKEIFWSKHELSRIILNRKAE